LFAWVRRDLCRRAQCLKLISDFDSLSKRQPKNLYLKHQITFLKYLKLILHEHRVDVTQYQCGARKLQPKKQVRAC
jgi:hypothetical protein